MNILPQLADGLVLEKTSCPLGVLLIVFESRPDSLVQVNVICSLNIIGLLYVEEDGVNFSCFAVWV